MPANAMVATDIGNVCSVSNSYLGFETAPSFLAAMTYGNCGYSFPAAIGAKVTAPAWHKLTVCCVNEPLPGGPS